MTGNYLHMLIARAVLVALLATSGASDSSAAPALAATPSAPAATVVTGATHELRLGTAKLGRLDVSVKATETPTGTTIEGRFTRSVNCRLERSGIGGCVTKYDVRRALPASAFTYDRLLDEFSLTTKVENKSLTITWTGYGDTTRMPNEAGALLIEQRDAVGVAKWGRYQHTDKRGPETTSMLYRRIMAP